jgi:hypothetical protein
MRVGLVAVNKVAKRPDFSIMEPKSLPVSTAKRTTLDYQPICVGGAAAVRLIIALPF